MYTEIFSIASAEQRSHRLLIVLLWAPCAVAFAIAPWYSTWLWAFLVGVPAALVPTWIVKIAPRAAISKISVGIALMVYSALYIDQTRGVTEMHFHVFCALAFLLAYRDWRPVLAAAATIAV